MSFRRPSYPGSWVLKRTHRHGERDYQVDWTLGWHRIKMNKNPTTITGSTNQTINLMMYNHLTSVGKTPSTWDLCLTLTNTDIISTFNVTFPGQGIPVTDLVRRVHHHVELVVGPGQSHRKEQDPGWVLIFEKPNDLFTRSRCIGLCNRRLRFIWVIRNTEKEPVSSPVYVIK